MNTVLLRVSSKQSSHRPPVHADNKYELIKLCHESFKHAVDCDFELILICDALPEPWLELFKPDRIEYASGNKGTFHRQVELARDKDKVLFLEDDYYWRPHTLSSLFRSLDQLPFVSPYDHPSHYLEERFDKHYDTRLIDGVVYRRAPSNTLTFATTGLEVEKHFSTLMSFGVNDHGMFQAIGEIWNPTYSMATHMVEGLLAPNVTWPFMVK